MADGILKVMVKAKPDPKAIRKISRLTDEIAPTKKNEAQVAKESENQDLGDENKKEQIAIHAAVNQKKAQEEAWARRRIEEIEAEIKKLAEERKQQILKRRKELPRETQEQKIAEEQKKKSLPEVTTKRKKGLPFWGRRIKIAQQQAQPERAGRKIGG